MSGSGQQPDAEDIVHRPATTSPAPSGDAPPLPAPRLLGAALSIVDAGVIVTDPHGTILWVNPAFTAHTGYPPEEAIGRDVRMLGPDDRTGTAHERLWTEIRAGRRWEGELVERRRDGRPNTLWQTVVPVEQDGEITHFVGVQEDITHLRENQARLRALFDDALDAILFLDDTGRLIEANPAAQTLTGYDLARLQGRRAPWLIEPADREAFLAGWPRLLRDGQRRGRVALRRRDGEVREVEYQAVARVLEGVHLAIVRDVTEASRAERSRRFQAEVLAAVGEAVIVTDVDGRIEYFNAVAEELFGYEAGEVHGRHIREIAGSEDAFPRGDEVLSALRDGHRWSGQLEVSDRTGRRFPIWVTSTPLLDEQGRLTGAIGVSRDIRELRAAQEQAQRRAHQQEVVAQLGTEVLDAHDLDAVLTRACAVVAEVLDVELAKVLELEPTGTLRLRAGVGWDVDADRRTTVTSSPTSQAGYTLTHEGPVIVADFAEEQRFAAPPLLVDHDVVSGMSVAVPRQEEVFGVLGVHSRRPRAFTADDAAFLRSIAHLLGAAADRHAATVELERLALTDRLTGLANRALLFDRLERHLARGADVARERVVVLLADLASLKLVNDGLGRPAGDELLIEVADRLRRWAPTGSTVARVGDDEFVLVLPDGDGDEAVASSRGLDRARSLRAVVGDHYRLSGREVFVDVAVGIAVGDADDDAAGLLRKAEAASRHAKTRRTDRIALYEPAVGGAARGRIELINELRHAVAEDQLVVHYQPEIDLGSGGLFGVEALVRWRHPERGLLPPGAFLDTAEGIGLTGEIGHRVLRRACHDVVALASLGGGPALAVNVSADELADPGFVARVSDTLAETGLAPERLFLEMTERAIIEDHDRTLTSLRALRARGVRIALDDFGTGYSSLTHLHRFPLDLLKIDRSFVAEVGRAGAAGTIVEATVALAHTLGLRCVAEGVETGEQLDALRKMGCDIVQGFRYSPALPVDELRTWLATHLPEGPGARRVDVPT